jgi:hypothetical protein
MAHPEYAAREIEMAVDDDEEDSYVHLWLDAGGYLTVMSSPGMDAVYCELLDQANGFESRTVRYEIAARKVKLPVAGAEYLDQRNRIQQFEVLIPEGVADMYEVEACLAATFDANKPGVAGTVTPTPRLPAPRRRNGRHHSGRS